MPWLVKSDPDEYAAEDLERDGKTCWDGVRNAQAQQNLRKMKSGDLVLVYHSGKPKAVVAVARVARDPYPDPTDDSGRYHAVDLEFAGWLEQPVPLKEIKADPFFETFDLVRQSRLSVMPVTQTQWNKLQRMADSHARQWADGR